MGLLGWLKGGGGRREEEKVPAAAPPPVPASSRLGIDLVAAGRYAEACDAFRQAIEREPEVAAHRVNLAFALQESGDAVAAVGQLKQATELDATSFDAHYMLGGALEQSGDLADAANALRQAVGLQPAMERAHADLIRVLARDEQNDAADAAADAALARFPESANLHVARGNLHMAAGKMDEALASFDRALAVLPGDINVRLNRALALHVAKRFEEALGEYDSVLATDPMSGKAHAGRGGTLREQGEFTEAIVSYRRALELNPHEAEWLNLLGVVLQHAGEMDAAIASYRDALRLRPDLPGGYVNLGLALAETGDVGGAIAEYDKGLGVGPLASTHANLGIALQKAGVLDGAIYHYREALKMEPENFETRCNLAAALCDAGESALSISELRQLLELDKHNYYAHSNLLFNLSVYGFTSPEKYLEEARRFDANVTPLPVPVLPRRPRRPGAPLRVGFVSGDLRNHPVGFFLESILANLDASRFELWAYPTIYQEDALTARIRPLFTGWKSLKGLTVEKAVQAIRSDGIDILFDLGGHTGENRLPVFAARAAPVQITWLGYFASTGVSAMDYVLADDVCVPPGMEHQFTEKVWRLPQTRLCLTPPDPATTPAVSTLPALERGYVTFGCFQRLAKINASVLDAWGEVFTALPSARLYLQGPQTGRDIYVEQILTRLKAIGIEASRVTIKPPASRAEYLRAHAEVDIILDTFPFNGGTTTSEALWMGVPTVTLAGTSMIGRQGMAMMSAVGLGDWVGEDVVGLREPSRRTCPKFACSGGPARQSPRDRKGFSPF